ncbi:hypothetical protein K505DRAFT_329222 [Melanomma pulvis-pyrius CBS 109.77]|uniref:Uncharacterized protein n=1 Tax=Melanomma pulvis-pyrius CBS 109.77 TaxID=1314802 RepID=A0A6A6WVU9_9PLEO|nr:hypothetical protein K505DRAFT_329222 [Melanomma pulvis-pyrius CBS 109.77]
MATSQYPTRTTIPSIGSDLRLLKVKPEPDESITLRDDEIGAMRKFMKIMQSVRYRTPQTAHSLKARHVKTSDESNMWDTFIDCMSGLEASDQWEKHQPFEKKLDSSDVSNFAQLGNQASNTKDITKKQIAQFSIHTDDDDDDDDNSDSDDDDDDDDDDNDNDDDDDDDDDDNEEEEDEHGENPYLDGHYQAVDSRSPSGSGSSKTNSTSSAITTPSSTATGAPAVNNSTNSGARVSQTGSSDDTQVEVNTRSQGHQGFAPYSLVCWHAANGIGCVGNCGRSPEARRLLADHSLSSKSLNTHKLPGRCRRCKLLFADKSKKDEHNQQLESTGGCQLFTEEERNRRNAPLERSGITKEQVQEIDGALKAFKKKKVLPQGCDSQSFDEWVEKYVQAYINKSDTPRKKAVAELSSWYIIFYTLFTRTTVPNPFVDTSEIGMKYNRILDIFRDTLRRDSALGLLPLLSDEHHTRLLAIFKESMERSDAESLLHRKEANRPKHPPRKKARTDRHTSSENTPSFPPALPPAPASAMGPPNTMNYGDIQTPSASYPNSQQGAGTTGQKSTSPVGYVSIDSPHSLEAFDFDSFIHVGPGGPGEEYRELEFDDFHHMSRIMARSIEDLPPN